MRELQGASALGNPAQSWGSVLAPPAAAVGSRPARWAVDEAGGTSAPPGVPSQWLSRCEAAQKDAPAFARCRGTLPEVMWASLGAGLLQRPPHEALTPGPPLPGTHTLSLPLGPQASFTSAMVSGTVEEATLADPTRTPDGHLITASDAWSCPRDPRSTRTTTPPSQCAQSPEQPTCGPCPHPRQLSKGHVTGLGLDATPSPSLLRTRTQPFSSPLVRHPSCCGLGQNGSHLRSPGLHPGVLCWVLPCLGLAPDSRPGAKVSVLWLCPCPTPAGLVY